MLDLMLNFIKWCWRTISQSFFFLLYFQRSVDKTSLTTNLLLHLSLISMIPLANLNQTCRKHNFFLWQAMWERVAQDCVTPGEVVCLHSFTTFNTLQMQICKKSGLNRWGMTKQLPVHFLLLFFATLCVCVFIFQIKFRAKYHLNVDHCFRSGRLVILVSLLLSSEFSA